MSISISGYVMPEVVNEFNGYPVNANYTVNIDMLGRFISVLDQAIDAYGRLFVFRFDLRFPQNMMLTPELEKRLIDRFISSFKAKVRHNRAMAKKLNPNTHDTVVRYVWVRELNKQGVPHYHFMIMLNRDAFNSLGSFNAEKGNLYTRLVEAWASALGIMVDEASGLVNITNGGAFHLLSNSQNFTEVKNQIVHSLSYLAKDETKSIGDGRHRFGCSRL